MKTYIYTRVPNENQELQNQIDACKIFCKFKGLEISKIYIDVDRGANF